MCLSLRFCFPSKTFLKTQKDQLIIKDARGSQGENVFVGAKCSEEQWQHAIDMASKEGEWLIQEHCDSLPFTGQCDSYGLSNFDYIWGLFGFGDTYGGANIRMKQRIASDGVINLATGAMEAIVLEVC